MSMRRRSFLAWSGACLTTLGWGGMPPLVRRLQAAPAPGNRKILFIFLRGGLDAVQAVIPYGDRGLRGRALTYEEARRNLRPNRAATHDLNGFAHLFPTGQEDGTGAPRLADIFHGEVDERGRNLAIVHRVGYESQNRSHFSSQQFWENGVPGRAQLEEGVFNRYLSEYADPRSLLPAATLDNNQMVLLKGRTLVPVLRSVDDFALPVNVKLGVAPGPGSPLGEGLKGAYGQAGFDGAISYESLTYSVGRTLLDSLQFFEENVRGEPYAPEPDAIPCYEGIGDTKFRGFVRDCARLLKQVEGLRVAGCSLSDFDTHTSQHNRFPGLFRDLATALTALYHDLKPIWDDTVVVTLTEFGRASMENATAGTDHGEATCIFLMGGAVNGGVYNCSPDRWENGALFSTPDRRYVSHRTDYRRVYYELLAQHMGDPEDRIDTIIPGYSDAATRDSNGYFAPLGLFRTA